MNKYTFDQIRESVLQWSQSDIPNRIASSEYFEITKNEKEVLLIDLTFENCLAQIVVTNPIFAPYQYVSFEAMTLESKRSQETGKPEMIYFFYDSADMLEKEVIEELKFGVKLCSDYIPDRLGETYINKSGVLIIKNENLRHLIHPDDVKKYKKGLSDGDFMCTEIQSQYLVVKNDLISLRVLPQLFSVK
jgi:hypothetical protein